MASAIHDTIVVCRPEQVREAAVVLSCCPGNCLTPLIVAERSPVSETEYRQRYAAYVEVRNQRDALTGPPVNRAQADPQTRDALQAANRKVDDASMTLTSYRSWWRHQRQVADLLKRQALRRAVILFEPDPDEFGLIQAVPLSQIPDERSPFIPKEIEQVFLLPESPPSRDQLAGACMTYQSLSDLPELAWSVCGRTGDFPATGIDVSETDTPAYFAGLWKALRTGIPLRPNGSSPPLSGVPPQTHHGVATPAEAVLIEVSQDASKLLGVQYAHKQNARLILYPEPDARAVEAARARVEGGSDAVLKSMPQDAKLFGALKEYLFGDPAIADGIRRLEQEVSALVPDEVVASVGDLDLTVFTAGVPYHFLKKGKADWSSKAIGHVAGDASLLMLNEFCGSAPGAKGSGFSLIFDPGFFPTTETSDVLAVLQKRFSYPLVLNGFAASGLALLNASASMPIDFLFFNTHGSDKAILLSDGPLPAYKLLQRQSLESRPFVFNSSCLSWVGVGREFMRIGARGYIGTLWSVNASSAANYARIVLQRVTQEGWPVSRAMRNTSIDRSTERA